MIVVVLSYGMSKIVVGDEWVSCSVDLDVDGEWFSAEWWATSRLFVGKAATISVHGWMREDRLYLGVWRSSTSWCRVAGF